MSKIGIPLEKPFSLYIPDDFRTFPGATLIYTGELNTFYYGRLAESMVKRRIKYADALSSSGASR